MRRDESAQTKRKRKRNRRNNAGSRRPTEIETRRAAAIRHQTSMPKESRDRQQCDLRVVKHETPNTGCREHTSQHTREKYKHKSAGSRVTAHKLTGERNGVLNKANADAKITQVDSDVLSELQSSSN